MSAMERILLYTCAVLFTVTGSQVLAHNPNSTCTDLTVNSDGDNTCYTVTPPQVDDAVFTIDGAEGAGEWTGAKEKTLEDGDGNVGGSVKMLRSQGSLYLLVTMDDPVQNSVDELSVYFDVLHNGATLTDDTRLRIRRNNGTTPTLHKSTGGGALATWTPATNGSAVAMVSGGANWVIEAKVTAAELGSSDLPQLLGLGIHSEDIDDSSFALWPHTIDTDNATTWANFKTRFPIEYLVVLDYSGSMLSDSKWINATNATNYLVNAMAMLKNATFFTDQVGLATFSWSCSGGDTTAVAKALTNVPAFPAGDYVGEIADPASNNCTPIGSGVNQAFTSLGTGVEERQRIALVLSDGLHNRPDSELDLSELSYVPCGTASWNPCSSSVIQINTVAFGEGDWSVDTDLLNDIKNYYNGGFGATFNLSNDPNDLKESFISSLDELYEMNLVFAGASGTTFPVDPGNQKLIVISSWTTVANAAEFDLQLGGVTVPCNTTAVDNVVGFAVCAVDLPAAGNWQAVVKGTSNPLASDRLFALLDLDLRARFGIDQVVHGTGMDIVLTADLNQGGAPVLNDGSHPVEVSVAIQKPDEGLGTFLATTTPNCERTEPTLPRVAVDGNIVVVQNPTVPNPGAATAATSPDPVSSQFQLAQALLKGCDKSGLARSDDSLKLLDDGTQGDVTANDGLYTLRFTNTQFEGTYIFRFNASGRTAAGDAFARTKRQAEYVRVNVDPANTTVNTRVLGQSGTIVTMEYSVIPRDRSGGYLGPGHLEDVKFLVSGAQLVGGVRDYNNGIYAQIVRYDTRRGDPKVVPVVQDQPIGGPGTKGPVGAWNKPPWIVAAILAALVLLLLWLLIRCRSHKH